MTEWIDVNGAKIEKQYLEENISEAKSYQWELQEWMGTDQEHTHCLICNRAIPARPASGREIHYRALLLIKKLWMCANCYERFMK